jgi:hypothetical protein
MEETEKAEFEIQVQIEDATDEELDRSTRQLLSELKDLDVESAKLTKGEVAPEGSKGEPSILGSIVVSALPTVLPAIVAFVQSWSTRGRGRTVKFKGRGIEFEGSPEELQKLLVSIEADHLAKEKRPAKQKERSERKTKENADQVEQDQLSSRPARSPRIFISYRRADSADVTGRIYDRLVGHFGKSAIFKDVDSIPAGADFQEHLEIAVGKCKIFLVVIGDKWLERTGPMRKYRLEDQSDFVRIEIEAALNRDILIIPLFVRGASMPAGEKLPPSLQRLVYRNGMPIRPDPDFHGDVDRLIAAISDFSRKKSESTKKRVKEER